MNYRTLIIAFVVLSVSGAWSIAMAQEGESSPVIDGVIEALPGPFGDFVRSAQDVQTDITNRGSDAVRSWSVTELFRSLDAWFEQITGITMTKLIEATVRFGIWILGFFQSIFEGILNVIRS